MIELDKRSAHKISRVIEWLPTNPFWAKNILSAEKLRLQFDRLELEMLKPNTTGPGVQKTNEDYGKKVLNEFSEQIAKGEIELKDTSILFQYGSVYDLIEFNDSKFKEKLLNRLKRMNLDVSKLQN